MLPLSDTTSDEFQRRVHKALRCWHRNYPKQGLLNDLLITQQLGSSGLLTRRQSTNLLLERALEQLAVFAPKDADLLRLRFSIGLHVNEVQQCIHYSASMVYVKQGRAIAHLAAILYQWEAAAQQRLASGEDNMINFEIYRGYGDDLSAPAASVAAKD